MRLLIWLGNRKLYRQRHDIIAMIVYRKIEDCDNNLRTHTHTQTYNISMLMLILLICITGRGANIYIPWNILALLILMEKKMKQIILTVVMFRYEQVNGLWV